MLWILLAIIFIVAALPIAISFPLIKHMSNQPPALPVPPDPRPLIESGEALIEAQSQTIKDQKYHLDLYKEYSYYVGTEVTGGRMPDKFSKWRAR